MIPTAIGLRNEKASKGAVASFLIATPQTGIDSILATFSLMGLGFAIIRPIAALVTGVCGGLLVNRLVPEDDAAISSFSSCSVETGNKIWRVLKYAYFKMIQDIGGRLVIGLLVAALIQVAIPDGDSGLSDFGYAQKEMYIGISRYIDWPNVDSYYGSTHLDKSMGSIWKVTEDGEEYFPWYFNVSNLKTNWGYLFYDNDSLPWTLSTCTEPSLQHQGEIDHLTLKMSNAKENTATVYGIAPDGTATVIAQPDAGYWSSSEKYYDYDFTVGSYNGFRIESGGPLYVTMLRISFYAQEGE